MISIGPTTMTVQRATQLSPAHIKLRVQLTWQSFGRAQWVAVKGTDEELAELVVSPVLWRKQLPNTVWVFFGIMHQYGSCQPGSQRYLSVRRSISVASSREHSRAHRSERSKQLWQQSLLTIQMCRVMTVAQSWLTKTKACHQCQTLISPVRHWDQAVAQRRIIVSPSSWCSRSKGGSIPVATHRSSVD